MFVRLREWIQGLWSGVVPCSSLPNIEHVVIATTGQVFSIRAPFKTTHFLSMCVYGWDNVLPLPNIVMDNLPTSATAAHNVVVPAERTNSSGMSLHDTHSLHSGAVPQFNSPCVQEKSQKLGKIKAPLIEVFMSGKINDKN